MSEVLARWLTDWGIWGVLFSILLNGLINVLGIAPSVLVTGTNVLAWGPIWGGGISWAGELFGAGIAFWLYRKGIHGVRKGREISWKWIKRFNDHRSERQFFALLAARMTPFIPSAAVNLAGALTKVSFSVFLTATAVGKIPSIALEVLVSYDLIHIQENVFRLLSVLLLITAVWLVTRPRRTRT
jgi:uncharacterized membrane protein YdjX (TVP38/TMEM64 family)